MPCDSRLLRGQGCPADALALLQPVYDDTADLNAAKPVLDAIVVDKIGFAELSGRRLARHAAGTNHSGHAACRSGSAGPGAGGRQVGSVRSRARHVDPTKRSDRSARFAQTERPKETRMTKFLLKAAEPNPKHGGIIRMGIPCGRRISTSTNPALFSISVLWDACSSSA